MVTGQNGGAEITIAERTRIAFMRVILLELGERPARHTCHPVQDGSHVRRGLREARNDKLSFLIGWAVNEFTGGVAVN